MRSLLAIAIVLTCASCSVVIQDSKRNHSVMCSTTRFWYLSDLAIAGASAYALSRPSNPPHAVAFVPSGLMAASGLIGIYKRHNCVRWRETAPPEVWAAVAEQQRRQAEADARAAAEAAAHPPQLVCINGAVPIGDTCGCPDGTSWDGAQCSAVAAAPAPSPTSPSPSPRRPPASSPPPAPVIVHRPPPAPPKPLPQSNPNPAWRALYRSAANAPQACQQFDRDNPNMAACSRFCTAYLVQKLPCSCDVGTCR